MTGEILRSILAGIPWTVALTLVAFSVGAILGLPLCAMRVSSRPLLRFAAGLVVLTFRSIPPIVWLFIIFFGIGSGYLNVGAFEAAAIGLGLITAANMCEIYRGALSAIHAGQWEAAAVLALPLRSRFVDVIGPQLLRIALPSAATYMIGLLKDSAISSTIGVQEIAFDALHVSQRTFHGLDVFAMAGLAYIVISLPIAALARLADVRLRASIAR